MWMTIIGFLGGPVIKGLIDAYQAKLKAGNVDNKIAADLAASEIVAQTLETQSINQFRIAEIGHPWEVDKLFAYVTLVYYAKLLIFDKVVGSLCGYTASVFQTDGLTSYDAVWGGMVITYHFGKRGFENVMQIIKSRSK